MRARIGAHQSLFDKIDFLALTAQPLGQGMDYVKSELCKYCCILACAAIDVCIEDCLLEYSDRGNDKRLTSYVKWQVSRARNPTFKTLCNMLDSFDGLWKDSLEAYATDTIRSDIGSIVHNRNEIAHGRTSTITFGRLMPWIKTAKELCAEIEKIIFV
jgi:hypothetical protein